MRGVSSRATAAALLVLMLATPAFGDGNDADPSLWAQFQTWINARIGIPIGVTSNEPTFEEWLVLMARIGIPIG